MLVRIRGVVSFITTPVYHHGLFQLFAENEEDGAEEGEFPECRQVEALCGV